MDRGPGSPRLRLRFATASGVVLAVLAAMSCSDGRREVVACDAVQRRCRTVCDYWCDGWGCYPTCWDQCWDDCYVFDTPPPGVAPPAGDGDASVSRPPSPAEGAGVLCSSCGSNLDCKAGALCIVRGGAQTDSGADGGPSGAGFCGHPCGSSAECPRDFVCTPLGSSRQCLPASGACN